MKLTSFENNILKLEEVYNPIVLTTNDEETLSICMRDSGFEFTYQDNKYSAQKGIIKLLKLDREILFKMWVDEIYYKYKNELFDVDYEILAIGFFIGKGLTYENAVDMYQYCIESDKF